MVVHLTAPNKDKARHFYTSVLGLKEMSWNAESGRGEWQVPGGATLVAHVQQPDEPGRAPGTVSGIVFAASDVARSVAEVKKRGGQITDEPWKAPWGPTYATVADPDGNEFVLIQRR